MGVLYKRVNYYRIFLNKQEISLIVSRSDQKDQNYLAVKNKDYPYGGRYRMIMICIFLMIQFPH